MQLSRAALAAMLSDQPLLLADGADTLARSIFTEMAELPTQVAGDESAWYFTSESQLAEGRPYRLTRDGLAVIPVSGMLLHRVDAHYPGWFTGYNYIESLLEKAMADSDVAGVMFDVNSPGGMVSGCFELCDRIHAFRGQKPMMALVDASGYSAAYAIASSANVIVGSPSAGVGSIGVITMHVDMSGMLEKFGVKITMLYKGKHKAEGNPYEPLSAETRERIDASLEKSYTRFVELVSRNRGLDAKAVRDTEASTYDAEDALALGLVDAVAPPREAVASFVRELSGSNFGGNVMATANVTTDTPAAGDQTAAAAPDAAALAEARAEGAAAERARIDAIMGCEEAKGRDSLARHLAFKSSMSADEAREMLAAAPVAAAAPAPAAAAADDEADPLAAAMAATEQPEVGAAGGNPQPEKSAAEVILGDYARATGYKPVH